MQLSLQTDYALRLLIYLMCRPDRRASAREIAEAYGISAHHLAKVAKILTRKGWLVAARGGGGGLTLAEGTPKVKVGDVVRFLETVNLAECFDPRANTCPISGACRLKGLLFQARRAFFEVLDACVVEDLTGDAAEVRRLLDGAASASGARNEEPRQTPRRATTRENGRRASRSYRRSSSEA